MGGAGLAEPTSGYFNNPFLLTLINPLPFVPGRFKGCGPIPEGKCYHGLSARAVNAFCAGIHKDFEGRSNHSIARSLAREATIDYVEQILDDPRVAGSDEAIAALFGVSAQNLAAITTGSLTFVIDDSASMNNDIDRVRSSVRTRLSQLISAGTPQRRNFRPVEFGLVRFADRIAPPFVTRSTTELLSTVDEIDPGGGGDCPESVFGALIAGLNASLNNSVLLLYTDAPSANDANLKPAFLALLKSKNVLYYYLNLPNDCGGAFSSSTLSVQSGGQSLESPSVSRAADDADGQSLQTLLEETAEQVFKLSDPSDLDRISDQLSLLISGDFVTIARARGTFTDGSSREFAVPVDSTVTRVNFSVTRDINGSASLLRPSGEPVLPGDAGVTFIEIPSGTFITVDSPQPGTWRLSLSGLGDFTLVAQGSSPIDLHEFGFVELLNPAHRALAPISGDPVAGTTPIGLANVIGPFSTADFRLVTEAGDTLQAINLVQGRRNAADNEFAGSFSLPTVPFRVAVSGVDQAGFTYDRLFPPVFRAQSVTVEIDPSTATDALTIGAHMRLRFNVLNKGNSGSFDLEAVDSEGFVSRVSPDRIILGTNETGTFEVDLTVPPRIPEDTEVMLTATATSTVDPTLTNSATVITLTAKQPNTICGRFAATIIGTPRGDFLPGTNGKDVIHGLGSNDIIRGLGGNDVICGGGGRDTVRGGGGRDTVRGGRGNDRLLGQRGKDFLFGQRGNDALDGGPAFDFCNGGPGRNVAVRCERVRNREK